MDIERKSAEYAEKIKTIICNLACKGELDGDMTMLDATPFEKVFKPLFKTLDMLQTDAQMAIDGDWDVVNDVKNTGFKQQIKSIKKL